MRRICAAVLVNGLTIPCALHTLIHRMPEVLNMAYSWCRVNKTILKKKAGCNFQPTSDSIWCPGPESNRHGVATEGF